MIGIMMSPEGGGTKPSAGTDSSQTADNSNNTDNTKETESTKDTDSSKNNDTQQKEDIQVTIIADKAYIGNKTIDEMIIPAEVKTIGKEAFKDNKKLTTVDFSKCSITTIGKNAFYGDKKLKVIRINGNKLKKV